MTRSDRVARAWSRIETWLRAHAPALADALSPPASADDIDQLAIIMNTALPSDYVASLLIHDGQRQDAFEVFGDWEPLGARRALQNWGVMKALVEEGAVSIADDPGIRADGPIRPRWWNLRWVPLASDGTGDLLCVDLDPAPGGTPGQVIRFRHDAPQRAAVAPGVAEWLDRTATDLESGRYVVTPGGELASTRAS